VHKDDGLQTLFDRLAWCVVLLAPLVAWATTGTAAQLRIELGPHSAAVRRLAVSPDGDTFATVGDDKTGRLWRTRDGQLLATLRVRIGDGDVGRLSAVHFSPDGTQVAVAGISGLADAPHDINLFDARSGVHLRSLTIPQGHVVRLLWDRPSNDLVSCLAGRDSLVITGQDGQVRHSETYGAPCYALAALRDGEFLSGAWDGLIRRYRWQQGRWSLVGQWRPGPAEVRDLAVSPDGRHVAVAYRTTPGTPTASIDVFEVETGRRAKHFDFHQLAGGNLFTLAWSGDGRTLAVSGNAGEGSDTRITLKRIAWPGGDVSSDAVASDTVQDLQPLGADRFLAASSNGSWFVIPARGGVTRDEGTVRDLRGARQLLIDPTGTTVVFGGGGVSRSVAFSLPRRVLIRPEDVATEPPRQRTLFGTQVTAWENLLQPRVAGQAVDMELGEVSRSYTLLPEDAGVVLATSRRIRRFDASGRPLWSTRVPSEALSVNQTADGRLVLAALRDGTVRWYRAADGRLLVSLFVSLDERWVLWTEEGFFDASPGADSMVGWHVNRPDGGGADFHSIGVFRDRYHRGEVIDHLLQTLDPRTALQLADLQRGEHVASAGTTDTARPAQGYERETLPPSRPVAEPAARPAPDLEDRKSAPEPAPVLTPIANAPTPSVRPRPLDAQPVIPPAQVLASLPAISAPPRLPPVVEVHNERSIASGNPSLRIRFSVRSQDLPADTMLVRVNGRPADIQELRMPQRQDGRDMGEVRVQMPPENARISVIALSGDLASEPVAVLWDWRDTVATVQPPTPPLASGGETGKRPATRNAGRLFVVSIGVSDYARREYQLGLPAKDATDFATLMSGQGGRMYVSTEARLLTNREATVPAVRGALEWLRQVTGPQDTAMIFLAGHGVNDADGRYYFLTHEADVQHLSRTSLSEVDLRRSLAGLKGRTILFVDTCHAGNVVGKGAALSAELSRFVNRLAAAENGVVVFSSSTGRQESIEQRSWGNGAFTKALLEGLKGAADFRRDGVVTHQGLSYYLRPAVERLTNGRQTPVTAVPLGVADYPMIALAGT
jgi:hypothetical protein